MSPQPGHVFFQILLAVQSWFLTVILNLSIYPIYKHMSRSESCMFPRRDCIFKKTNSSCMQSGRVVSRLHRSLPYAIPCLHLRSPQENNSQLILFTWAAHNNRTQFSTQYLHYPTRRVHVNPNQYGTSGFIYLLMKQQNVMLSFVWRMETTSHLNWHKNKLSTSQL